MPKKDKNIHTKKDDNKDDVKCIYCSCVKRTNSKKFTKAYKSGKIVNRAYELCSIEKDEEKYELCSECYTSIYNQEIKKNKRILDNNCDKCGKVILRDECESCNTVIYFIF